eukprot:CAMPEP_0185733974 /NCGR_PEP_ID=MMETSP1171-20130828/21038_1 /TAXON_ID=374046 /ORGANISM="Helicotheca tamensis, Strain CCMP826" /LENGTH=57 /DNA_ID=CAMNT_0028403843 /DNA_START=51 /DNA_END=220 /DNA_ORIENTATION=-
MTLLTPVSTSFCVSKAAPPMDSRRNLATSGGSSIPSPSESTDWKKEKEEEISRTLSP